VTETVLALANEANSILKEKFKPTIDDDHDRAVTDGGPAPPTEIPLIVTDTEVHPPPVFE
jgi:hypothetical protein